MKEYEKGSKELQKKIKNRNAKVAVCGLGYVGLPLAILCSQKGYRVFGIDTDQKKTELINRKVPPFKDEFLKSKLKKASIEASTNFRNITKADVIVICVPTPVDRLHRPVFKFITDCGREIAKYLHEGQLVVLESTVNPGATEEILVPVLAKSGLKAGAEFYLAFCPERIDPGNKNWQLEDIPRVVGGISKESITLAVSFYKSILNAKITPLSSIKAAEAAKIVENTFRDINIAFVNELAMSFDQFGIDILEVLKGASTKPFAFLPHYPGCGVGGHCIPVDPYVPQLSTHKSLEALLKESDYLVLVTEHAQFTKIEPQELKKHDIKAVIDGRNCLNKEQIENLGIIYKGIGR